MENVIYNEMRHRGFLVDVGNVNIRMKNEKDEWMRVTLEVDFVCNKGYDRVYIQSALNLDGDSKEEQELASLKHINDNFQKVVIVGGMQPTYRNNDGILVLNIFDFLQNKVAI